jgi:hypothetical protein
MALQQAIKEELPLAELECLGLRERVVNLLEKAGIQTVKDAIKQWDRIKSGEIRQIGPVIIKEILDSLSNIHLLEEKRIEYVKQLMPNYEQRITKEDLYVWSA